MKDIPQVSLSDCEYFPEHKLLTLSSRFVGMPSRLFVHSSRTGKTVKFMAIGPEDKLFDPDYWDGEQQIYRPVGDVSKVDRLVIHNS